MQYAPTMLGRSTNVGRGLQPRSKRLDAPERRYITKRRDVFSMIVQK